MLSLKLIPDTLDLIPYKYGLDAIPADITKQELLYYFSLTDDKKAFIERHCRLSPSRIALAIQLGAYGFIGRPQEKPEEAPPIVIRFLAEALKLQGEFIPLEYSNRSMTRWDHDNMARQFLGLSLFSPQQHDILIDYLTKLCPDPGNYFDWIKKAEDFLREKRFVLPTVNVLRRLIASARHQSLERVFNQIYSQLGDERINNLERLLGNDDEVRSKWFGLTNKNVYSATTTKVSEVLNRIKEIREFSLHEIDVTTLPDQYLRHLAYQGIRLSSKQLKKCSPLHRYATMAIALRALESEYIDIAMQMNDEILAGVFLRGKQRLEIYLKKHRKTVEQVFYAFNVMSDAMLDEAMNPVEKFEHISQEFPSDKMRTLRQQTAQLHIPRGSEGVYFASGGHQTIQKYLPQLLETITIVSPSKHDPLVEAAQYFLERKQQGKPGIGNDAPTEFIQEKRWKGIVLDQNGKPKSRPWIVCLADNLRKSFRRGSLEITGARQYRSLNSDLIPWTEWNVLEKKEDDTLPFTASAEKAITPLFQSIQRFSGDYERWTGKNSEKSMKKAEFILQNLTALKNPSLSKNCEP